VLVPLGTAAAGPIAAAVGVKEALIASGVITVASNLIVVAQPVVWTIRRPAVASAV
jgi:hypothetical protein